MERRRVADRVQAGIAAGGTEAGPEPSRAPEEVRGGGIEP